MLLIQFVCLLQLNCMSDVAVDLVLVWDLVDFFFSFCLSFLEMTVLNRSLLQECYFFDVM